MRPGPYGGHVLVLWDADCGFCAFVLALLLRADVDRRLRPAPIQGPAGDLHLAHMSPERRLASFHAVATDGTLSSGGDALTALLAELPAGRPAAAVTVRLPRLTRRSYDWIATHRGALSRPIPQAATNRARALVERRSAGAQGAGVTP